MNLQSLCIYLPLLLVCTVFIVTAVKCPNPGATNAIVTRAVYEYECQAGHRLVGSSQLTCGPDGQWSSDPPVCQEECRTPLGIESGEIPDAKLTASSVYIGTLSWYPYYARLNNRGIVNAWCPATNDRSQWLQVDLGRSKRVSGIITQGASSRGTAMYISDFKVQYSENTYSWQTLKDPTGSFKIFKGNMDNNTPKVNMFDSPVIARFVRILPWKWQHHITIRMELLGCRDE